MNTTLSMLFLHLYCLAFQKGVPFFPNDYLCLSLIFSSLTRVSLAMVFFLFLHFIFLYIIPLASVKLCLSLVNNFHTHLSNCTCYYFKNFLYYPTGNWGGSVNCFKIFLCSSTWTISIAISSLTLSFVISNWLASPSSDAFFRYAIFSSII